MGRPGVIPGGDTLSDNATTTVVAQQPSMGVFAKNPGGTPKYAINEGQRDAEYRETMARLFIQMSEKERESFVQSVPPETRPLAQVLCGVGTGATGGTGFVDFILNQAIEPFQEKVQVVETLSDNFVIYTFGQAAPTFQYSGVLYNTYQDDQRVWMTRLYRDILRATQLARRRKLVRIRYDSVIVSGVFTGMQQSVSGEAADYASFSLTMIPTQYVIFSPEVGVATKLETAFTTGAEYALSTVEPVDLTKIKIAAPANVQAPSRKRTNQKSDRPWSYQSENAALTADVLNERIVAQQESNEQSNLYGGLLSEPQTVLPTS